MNRTKRRVPKARRKIKPISKQADEFADTHTVEDITKMVYHLLLNLSGRVMSGEEIELKEAKELHTETTELLEEVESYQ